MHFEKGTMNMVDYDTYTSLFEAMVMTPYFPHPDLLIYLEGSIDDILERIKERGRPMEQQTPISYWEEMHQRYEDWINNFSACPVLRLNINDYDVVQNEQSIEPIIERISHHMQQTQLLKR
jgi:deoxyadenosine/deoxycytidine kinase